jgi:tetratricopeptide (TPR) repeat protein
VHRPHYFTTLLTLAALGCRTPTPPPGVAIDGCRLLILGEGARCETTGAVLVGKVVPSEGCTFERNEDPERSRVVPGPEGCTVTVGVDRSMPLRIVAEPTFCDTVAPCEGPEHRARCAGALATSALTGRPAPAACAPVFFADVGERTFEEWAYVAGTAYDDVGWTRQAAKLQLVVADQALRQRHRVAVQVATPDPTDLELRIFGARVQGQRELLDRQYVSAMRAFREAVHEASRLGPGDKLTASEDRLAQALVRLGRFDEATAIYHKRLETSSACDRAAILNNVAWMHLMAVDLGVETASHAARSEEHLREAERLSASAPDGCRLAADLAVNRALASIQTGELAAASASLAFAQTQPMSKDTTRWAAALAAQVLVLKGDLVGAEAGWSALATAAAVDHDREFSWRAAHARAEIAWLRGDEVNARALSVAASAWFAGLAESVSLRERLDAYLAWGSRGVGAEVSRLLASGDTPGALAAGRAFRARSLARYWAPVEVARHDTDMASMLSERAALLGHLEGAPEAVRIAVEAKLLDLDEQIWALTWRSATRLGAGGVVRTPAPGEAIVHVAPLSSAGALRWVPLVATHTEVIAGEAFDVPAGDDERALLESLTRALAPAAASLLAQRQVTFVVPAFVDAADLAWMDLGTGPLISRVDVAWSADLAGRSMTPLTLRDVAMLANPSGDPNLRGARSHVEAIATATPGTRRVAVIDRDVETRAGLRALLERADVQVLHLAGHASSHGAPLDAALLLRDGVFSARDVLLNARVPQVVTLASCQSATSEGMLGGIGLSSSFVLAGADAVVGSYREVNSNVAFAFYEVLYARWAAHGDLIHAFREASLDIAERFPDQDVRTFRVLLASGPP